MVYLPPSDFAPHCVAFVILDPASGKGRVSLMARAHPARSDPKHVPNVF